MILDALLSVGGKLIDKLIPRPTGKGPSTTGAGETSPDR
jgi:hypothetical protein